MLPLENRENLVVQRVLTLCALPRAGKTTAREIVETLIPEDRRITFSTSDAIKEELIRQGITNFNDRKAKQEAFVRIAETQGEDWVIKKAAEAFWWSDRQLGILDCVCMPQDMAWLKTLPSWQWIPIYIEAPFQTRLKNANAAALRGGADSKPDEAYMTAEEFRKVHSHPTTVHITSFRNIPGTTVIRHNSGIENLGRQVVATLQKKYILYPSRYNEFEYITAMKRLLRFYDEFNRKIAGRETRG